MFAAGEAQGELAAATMTELTMRRAKPDGKIAVREERWVAASEALVAAAV